MIVSVLTLVALVIFIVATVYRVVRISSTPVHLRWELYPVPHEKGGRARYGGSYLEEPDWWLHDTSGSMLGDLRVMIPEIFLLKGVWEANRGLWFWSWSFHIGLYLLAASALVISLAGVLTFDLPPFIEVALSIGLTACFILGSIGSLGMVIKRLVDSRLRLFNTGGTIMNLIFILAIFVTGLVAVSRLSPSGFIDQMWQFSSTWLSFNGSVPLDMATKVHVAAAMLFAAYMPFTHMAHFILKYFTYHSVRWDDQPNKKGSALEHRIQEALKYRPTWAATHFGADGKKSWVDIATEEPGRDE
jgi:nitrate reductase gamma subunit